MADIITHQEDTGAAAAPGPAPRRKHALLGLIAALAITLTALISGIGAAKADTPSWTVSHVYMNLGPPGQSAQSQYYGLIQSLRNAAGHPWRNGVEQTQTSDTHSLIRLDLTAPVANMPVTVQLWLTANNLYLRGWTDAGGTTYSFNDYDLRGAMQPASSFTSGGDLLPAAATGGPYVTLPYGSDYNSMVQAAGRDRSQMPISYIALYNAWTGLANAGITGQQSVARAVMFMIQYTSESARFYDVWRVMNNIMGNTPINGVYPPAYNGVPAAAQEFENSWSQISQYAINLSNGSNPAPLNVGPNAGTLNNFGDVQFHMAEGLARPSQVSTNPLRDEL